MDTKYPSKYLCVQLNTRTMNSLYVSLHCTRFKLYLLERICLMGANHKRKKERKSNNAQCCWWRRRWKSRQKKYTKTQREEEEEKKWLSNWIMDARGSQWNVITVKTKCIEHPLNIWCIFFFLSLSPFHPGRLFYPETHGWILIALIASNGATCIRYVCDTCTYIHYSRQYLIDLW